MPKVYSYIRFSRPEQMHGDSLRRQLKAGEEWAAEHGLTIDEEMADLGLSAYRGKHKRRGNLGTFLALVEEGKVQPGSVLIVESLDRLSRERVLDAQTQFLQIVKAGVEIVTLMDGHRYSLQSIEANWTELIISLSIMARAYEESLRKGERVASAWADKRRRARTEGHAISRACPEWLRIEDGRYVPIPERVATLRRVFEMAAGGMGRRSIVKALNSERVEPWGRGGRKGDGWQDSYINKLLEWPAVLGSYQPCRLIDGKRVPDGDPITDYYPAVIPEDLYWRAVAAAKARRQGGGRKGSTYSNLLSGLVKCGHCGARMAYEDKGRRSAGPSLVCDHRVRRLGCDHGTRYRYHALETGVFFGLGRGRLADLAAHEESRRGALEAELAAAEAKAAKLAADLGQWMDTFGIGAGPDIAQRIARLQAETQEARAEADRLRREVGQAVPVAGIDSTGAALMAVYREMQAAEGEERYRIRADLAQRLKALVERIELKDGVGVIRYKDGSEAELWTSKAAAE